MNSELQNKILDLWINDEETVRIIQKLHLTPEQFKELFAFKIFQYLLDVYNKRTVLGDCPVVFAMLTIFKKYNLSITEIHHICDTLKLKLSKKLIEENKTQLLFPFLAILRENFKGVLKSYMSIQYEIDIGNLNIINSGDYLIEGEACALDAPYNELESQTEQAHTDNKNLTLKNSFNFSEKSDYVKNYINKSETKEEFEILHSVITGEILDDFNETNEMFSDIATLEETYTQKYHELLSSSIDIYISIFLDLIFFNKIASSLTELKYLISDVSDYSDEQLLIMKELTESLMFNLIKWKEEIIDNHNQSLHYYDDAIIGDIEQLKVMLNSNENMENSTEEDLDDIFNF